MKSKWIKKGLPVVHITNLNLIMTVEDFVYETKTIRNESGVDEKVKHLMGIRCKMVDDGGEEKYFKHHSKELVPAEVASKGVLEACKFINREGQYKDM